MEGWGSGGREEETFYRKFLPPFPRFLKRRHLRIHRHLKNSVAGKAEHDGTDTAFDHDAEESAHQRAFGGLTGFVVVAPLVALHEITADPRAHESADERAKAKQQGKPRQSADKRAKQARPHAAGARTVFLAPPALRDVLDDLPE